MQHAMKQIKVFIFLAFIWCQDYEHIVIPILFQVLGGVHSVNVNVIHNSFYGYLEGR